MLTRALFGFVVAALVVFIARRTRSLARSGAAAATVVGTLAVAAGWPWAALLMVYFVTSTALSHAGRAEKERRTASVVAKGGERDARQVLANGSIFAVAMLAMALDPRPVWAALGAGALAASAADTWATEIGTLFGRSPRSILTGQRVAPGISGGVSLIGTTAALAGACAIGFATRFVAGPYAHVATAAVIGGFFGAMTDSLLGATIQSRRWCDVCARETERLMHDCGAETRPLRGLAWLDNDMVNFLSTLAGGLLAAAMAR